MLPPTHSSTPDATHAVLLVSPDESLCRTFSRELSRLERWWFIEAQSATDAYRAVRSLTPGALAVVDVGLGEGNDPDAAVELVRMLRWHGWRHIVAVGDADELDGVSDVLKAGAYAYLVGEHHQLPSTRRSTAGSHGSARPRTSWDPELNPRGVAVIELVARGLTNREIGRALGVGTETVKSHVARMSRRLGAHHRAHLVLIALRSGIIS